MSFLIPAACKGEIVFADDSTNIEFSASSPARALDKAMEKLGIRSLTRRTMVKARCKLIKFGERIIFPIKKKRTMDKRRDREVNYGRALAGLKLRLERRDVGRRRHHQRLPKAA